MTKGDDTRQHILTRAAGLATQIGLEGLSIGQLATDLGMSKSGLFAHFQSKQELQTQVVDFARERFLDTVVRPALAAPRGEPRVRALFERWIRWPLESKLPGGCFFVAAATELDAFEVGAWGVKFPSVVAAWRRAWDRVIPFFAFPPEVRRVIYTTNAIESNHARLRKIIKTRGHFPSDDAAAKLIWLALRNITADWGRAAKEWRSAMNQFAIAYGDRFQWSST